MDQIVVGDYDELSKKAADFVINKIKDKPNTILGLATGSTPIGLYKNLINKYKKGSISFASVRSFNLDEYCGLEVGHEQSYKYFMNQNLFNHINIDKANTYFPTCEQEEGGYDQAIQEAGGIDLQILGIGRNGHIGFNEPGSSFDSKTRVVDLAPSTIKDNARFFSDTKDVPRQAMTMGLKTIMETKEVLLLASGENKKEAVQKLLHADASEELPASVLQNHKNVTIIVDDKARAD
jgi:glucosamine-6-phosphate deaminase